MWPQLPSITLTVAQREVSKNQRPQDRANITGLLLKRYEKDTQEMHREFIETASEGVTGRNLLRALPRKLLKIQVAVSWRGSFGRIRCLKSHNHQCHQPSHCHSFSTCFSGAVSFVHEELPILLHRLLWINADVDFIPRKPNLEPWLALVCILLSSKMPKPHDNLSSVFFT